MTNKTKKQATKDVAIEKKALEVYQNLALKAIIEIADLSIGEYVEKQKEKSLLDLYSDYTRYIEAYEQLSDLYFDTEMD